MMAGSWAAAFLEPVSAVVALSGEMQKPADMSCQAGSWTDFGNAEHR